MIVTDKLLFLHLHKSGGTFVNALLMNCVPSARHIGYHFPYREVPATYRDRPVLGTVRSPWAYYVSWYHFQITRPKQNILFQVCSDGGTLGFKETIVNLVNLSGDEARLAMLEEGLPATYGRAGLNLTKTSVAELRERGLGFYSFLYERLYAGAESPLIIRAERLREELRQALTSLGELPNSCADQFLNESPPLNVSEHEPPADYFDEELARLIAYRDSVVVDRFGYSL